MPQIRKWLWNDNKLRRRGPFFWLAGSHWCVDGQSLLRQYSIKPLSIICNNLENYQSFIVKLYPSRQVIKNYCFLLLIDYWFQWTFLWENKTNRNFKEFIFCQHDSTISCWCFVIPFYYQFVKWFCLFNNLNKRWSTCNLNRL